MKFGCRSCGCDTLKVKRHWQLDALAFVVRLVLLSAVVAAAPRTTLGEEANESPEITPADVFAGVASVRAEVELLRHYMGKPRNEQPELGVKRAAPREVYFQALTLFVKADRFCFEQMRQRTPQVESPAGEPQPEDVRRVVDVVLDCVRQVKKHYDVELKAATIEVEPGKTPTDVFAASCRPIGNSICFSTSGLHRATSFNRSRWQWAIRPSCSSRIPGRN